MILDNKKFTIIKEIYKNIWLQAYKEQSVFCLSHQLSVCLFVATLDSLTTIKAAM